MRRLVFSIVLGVGLVGIGGTGAFAADPTPTATVSAKATPGKKICKIQSPLLDEVSGLVATKSGFIAINDSTSEDRRKVFFLDAECKVKGTPVLFDGAPLDSEDMIVSPKDGSIWIADTGDGGIRTGENPRPTVALWSMPANGKKKPVIHRLSYPDGDAHDAEALLMGKDGTPYIVTKELGTAFIYKPSAALKTDNKTGVPLTKVGELSVQATETAGNSFAKVFNRVITGGSVSHDGSKVVLRTYTDALEWDVKNGDILAALKNKPRTTGLPNEPFGEAISYSADDKSFFTVSDMNGDKETANWIRQYEPATTVATVSKKQSGAGAEAAWYSDLSVDDITYMVGGIGLVGLILVASGVFGIVRFRKQHPAGMDVDKAPSGALDPVDPATELIGVGGPPQRPGAAYGGNGPVYGAKSGPPAGGGQPRPGTYGGGAPQYARPSGGQPQQQPPRPPQGQPPRGPQQNPQQRPQQGQPPRPPQGQPARGPQGQPPRGPQQPRSPQPPARGPQQPPSRGGGAGGGVYGGQQGGGQRPPQGGQPRPPQGGQRPPQGGQQRPPQGGQRPPQGGQPRPPQGGQRPPQGRDDDRR
ncbi:hypothetical protein [Actinoplanes palleronii]|nr:hypothetical protein [Actinoplanes palleronii]